ncbi:MAG: hypothetical protein K0Q55_1641 [Verrucomicrobia bacterium]|nr:hypothetical protein [Verrucomicrobiota bacterium]
MKIRDHAAVLKFCYRLLPLLLLTSVLAGCTAPGLFLEDSAVNQVKPGMERQEVLKVVGQPGRTVKGPEGDFLDEYRTFLDQPTFSKRTTVTGNMSLRSLQVYYSADGKVTFVDSYKAAIPYWQQLNGVAHAGIRGGMEAVPKIEKGVTHLYELTEKIGEPMLVTRDFDGDKYYSWFVYEAPRNSNTLKLKSELRLIVDDSKYIADYLINEPKD